MALWGGSCSVSLTIDYIDCMYVPGIGNGSRGQYIAIV